MKRAAAGANLDSVDMGSDHSNSEAACNTGEDQPFVNQADASAFHLTDAMSAASAAGEDAENFNWPTGPSNMQDLYSWPQRYATKLLGHGQDGATARACLSELLKVDIVHHEGFSGSGGSGAALHMCHSALKRELNQFQPNESQSAFGYAA